MVTVRTAAERDREAMRRAESSGRDAPGMRRALVTAWWSRPLRVATGARDALELHT